VKPIVTVGLSFDERRLLAKANVHIRIAYPDVDPEDVRSQGARDVRAMRALVSGTPGTHAILTRAERALTTLAHNCDEQAEVDYWQEQLAATPAAAGPAGLPIIMPGADMPGVLAETRRWQLSEAIDALAVVQAALNIATPEEPTTTE
jgi:hypothetical protein